MHGLEEFTTEELERTHANISRWLLEDPGDFGDMSRLMLMCAKEQLNKELKRRRP